MLCMKYIKSMRRCDNYLRKIFDNFSSYSSCLLATVHITRSQFGCFLNGTFIHDGQTIQVLMLKTT